MGPRSFLTTLPMPIDEPTQAADTANATHDTSGGIDPAVKMEAAKRRLDCALNGLERRVAAHSDRLRQTNAHDVAALRSHARAVETEKRHLVEELGRLDGYLGKLEHDLAAARPPALPPKEN